MTRTKEFESVVTRERFALRDFVNCRTKGVVDIASSCPKNYVGKTKREVRRRILDYVGDIRNKRDTPLIYTHMGIS